MSANQLHRMLDITYETAWFMAHRIRFAMGPDESTPKLTSVVEADECFVGGKGDKTIKAAPKTPVVALIERSGNARVKVIASVNRISTTLEKHWLNV